MAGPEAPAAPVAVSASPNGTVSSDPLTDGTDSFKAALDEFLASSSETPAVGTPLPTAESVSDSTQAAPQEQAAEQAAETETDTQAASTKPTETPEQEPGTKAELPLKPRDEAALAALREKDPEAYRDIQRRLQGIEDRAAERAYQRLQKEQTVAGVTQKASDSGLQVTYEEMAPPERAAWVETLPEFAQARAAIATDLAGIMGVDPTAFTPEVLSDPESLQSVFLSGTVAKSRFTDAVKAEVVKQLKDADEAGYRRGKAEVRSTSSLPQSTPAAGPAAPTIKTPEDAMRAMRQGIADLVSA